MSSNIRDMLETALDDINILGAGRGIVYSIPELEGYVFKSSAKWICLPQLRNSTILSPTSQVIGSRNMGQEVMHLRNSKIRTGLSILQKQDGDSLEKIYTSYLTENYKYPNSPQRHNLAYLEYIEFLNTLSVEAYESAVIDLNKLDNVLYRADTNNNGNVLYAENKLSIIDFFTENAAKDSSCHPSVLLEAMRVSSGMSLSCYTQKNAQRLQNNKQEILHKVLEAFDKVGASNNLPVDKTIENHSKILLSSQGFTDQDREQYSDCLSELQKRSKPIDANWTYYVKAEALELVNDITPVELDAPVESMVERLEQVRHAQKEIDKLHDEPRR